jgi:hypothetical protein
MGEYAQYNGQDVKIGTCESMYYLRADQRHLIEGYTFDGGDRFRFPFPDEDEIAPGQFVDHDRGVRIPGWSLPAEWEGHGGVQFKAEPGYLLYVPCPEGQEFVELDIAEKIGRNGWHGGAMLKQQRVFDGRLVSVVACGSCGALWRLETIEDALPVIVAFRAEAERQEWRRGYDFDTGEYLDEYAWEDVHAEQAKTNLLTIAARIEAGYCALEHGPRLW